MKILLVFGTRPEAVKLASVIKELKKFPEKFEVKICVTGQHKEMLDPFLELFEIKPDFNLNLMKENQSLEHITTKTLQGITGLIQEIKPDYLIVQGDTTTAMASALSAFYNKVKVIHIEAGLRTYNNLNPFPEEVNRRIIDSVSDLFFAPTQKTKQNLLKEGFPENKIFVSGNTVIDVLLETAEKEFNPKNTVLEKLPENKKIILVTSHRRESFGKPLQEICEAIKEIALKENVFFVFPVHLNPKVKEKVYSILSNQKNILLTEPLAYFELVYLMKKSFLVLTDSGGIQEEAPSLNKPVLVLRKETERTEGIKAGTAILVGTKKEKIIHKANELLENKTLYNKMALAENPFGDGTAGKKIVKVLSELNE